MDTKWLRNSFIYLLILVAAIALFLSIFPSTGGKEPTDMPISDVVRLAKAGQIKKITVEGDTLIVERNDSATRRARVRTRTATSTQILSTTGVPAEQIGKIDVEYRKPPQFGNWLGLIVNLLPLIFFGALPAVHDAPGAGLE